MGSAMVQQKAYGEASRAGTREAANIIEMMISGQEGRIVVRLAGDPFIFGRRRAAPREASVEVEAVRG